jgi:hypothetical protein
VRRRRRRRRREHIKPEKKETLAGSIAGHFCFVLFCRSARVVVVFNG